MKNCTKDIGIYKIQTLINYLYRLILDTPPQRDNNAQSMFLDPEVHLTLNFVHLLFML